MSNKPRKTNTEKPVEPRLSRGRTRPEAIFPVAPSAASLPESYAATIEEIAKHGYVLTTGRYVGAEEIEEDAEPFAEKYPRLVAEVEEWGGTGGTALRPKVDSFTKSTLGCNGLDLKVLSRILDRLKLAFNFHLRFLVLR